MLEGSTPFNDAMFSPPCQSLKYKNFIAAGDEKGCTEEGDVSMQLIDGDSGLILLPQQ